MPDTVMCMNCGGIAAKSTTIHSSKVGERIVITRNVPCYRCERCGEISYGADAVMRMEENAAAAKGQEIAVFDYQ